MLDCFDGLVTLQNTCGAPTPGVMTLNNLGIDQTLIGKFTGAEDTPASVLENCEAWARATIHNDVVSFMGKAINAKTILEGFAVGNGDDDTDTPVTDTGIGGFLVECMLPGSNLKITLSSLGLFATTTGDVVIRIYDLDDGKEVATYTIEAVSGEIVQDEVQIVLPAWRRVKRYFVTHNLTEFYRTDITGCGGCSNTYHHGGVYVSGARMASDVPKRKSNIRYVNHSSGLLAVVSVSCDHGRMLCDVRDQLALPYTLGFQGNGPVQ
jgi:hypothetical protein